MKYFFLCFVFFLLIVDARLARCAFELEGAGARPVAMAGAFTAVADDAHALLFNPAGLWYAPMDLTAHFARLYRGLDDGSDIGHTFLGGSARLDRLGAGIGLGYSSLALSGFYRESQFLAGAAKPFAEGKITAGLALKSLSVAVGTDEFSRNAVDSSGNAQTGVADPVLAGRRSKSALSFHLGLLARPHPELSAGLSVKNINEPNVGLADQNRVPAEFRLGLAWRKPKGLLALDVARKQALQGVTDTVLALGGEIPFYLSQGALFGRFGYLGGSRNLRQMSFGFGWRSGSIQMDYAMVLPMAGLESGNNTHRVSLSYRPALRLKI